ncbi:PEP-CTERM protein-sorting domain-containing protein [Sphingomonas laterariae]|uniref:PEP-CTERM protein-sorting domain-containing protein n=1 Tax=Edaphosphingomonas laterariae TaxID=861865 RepID=A0A239HF01_9SPHN|nr:PEPxxWA-CTERM sorting domain-containing protein [Sphingomonas laterariae]SNS78854.1 PEP-CTERM protein-sorting domain-containing protein [Sphingomonas laterariae]
MVGFKSIMIGAAALAVAAVPASASAALLTFNLTGNSYLDGTDGNVRTFSATSGSTTINVKATAWRRASATGSTVQSAYLGAYSNGLGVTNSKEGSGQSGNSHTVDNKDGFDFIVFQFDQVVEVDQAYFSPYKIGRETDSDATIMVGNSATPFSSGLNFANWASVDALFNPFQAASGTAGLRDINGLNEQGNLLFVGASFTDLDKLDGFKLKQLKVNSVTPSAPGPVPEPATWAMMIAGFGLVGGAMRRRERPAALA